MTYRARCSMIVRRQPENYITCWKLSGSESTFHLHWCAHPFANYDLQKQRQRYAYNCIDLSMYRCIGLLPHIYKILSLIMLERIMNECSDFLSDWQAGFRPECGSRDNILLLRVLVDQIIKEDDKMCVTYIDFSASQRLKAQRNQELFRNTSHLSENLFKYWNSTSALSPCRRYTLYICMQLYLIAPGI